MKLLLISDRDAQTESYEKIKECLWHYFDLPSCEREECSVGRGEIAPCMGCFGCWVKTPGECVIKDSIAELNKKQMNSDAVIMLIPLRFGQFGSTMKNVVDRWLPNMLPYFEIRADGSTIHPPRYPDYPKLVMIGYGSELSETKQKLFFDINKKHRSSVEVLFWNGDETALRGELSGIRFERKGGSL